VEGVHRFLARVWRAFEGGLSDEAPTKDQLRALHTCIKKVGGAPASDEAFKIAYAWFFHLCSDMCPYPFIIASCRCRHHCAQLSLYHLLLHNCHW
jgi:hypothetical protein